MTQQFEVGKTYSTRSIGDHEMIFRFKILARTTKRLTIEERSKTYVRGIYLHYGVEHCKPHGSYSMCAIISADQQEPA